MDGEKEVLGLYLDEFEGAKYWLSVMTDLRNHGLNNVFILCADGLKGLQEAIESSFPKTVFQTCLVYLVRHSLKCVPYGDKKVVASDLNKIYSASTVELAGECLNEFETTWGEKYPAIVESWRDN